MSENMYRKCTTCGETKSIDVFCKDSSKADGIATRCKQCRYNCEVNWMHTIHGLSHKMYASMKRRIKLGFVPSANCISDEAFYSFAITNEDLQRLFIAWEESGFIIRLTPSIDRIDNKLGYEIGNLQFITQSENSSKGIREKLDVRVQKGEYMHPTSTHKWCPKCSTLVEKSLFNKNKSTKDGLASYCRACNKEYGNTWYNNNKSSERAVVST
jgi:hypothetical protein